MSKIRSCESCRKSKLRCEPGDEGSFPCKRCQRHGLTCVDPRLTAPVGEEDPAIAMISKVVRKQAKASVNITHTRMRALMFMRSMGLLYKYGHRTRLLDVLRSLAKTADIDMQDFLEKLPMPAETDAGPFRYTMRSEDCVHPYVGAFFAEGNASIVLVMMGGQARVICSEMWERVFFTQDEANRRFLLGNELLLENMMSLVHPDECRRLSETVEYTMFKADTATSEVSQIFKIRVPSCGAYIMALVRLRNVILYDGNYLCAGYSVLPLPLPTATSGKKCIKAEKRPLAFCPQSMDLFQATVQSFGEPDPALTASSAVPMIAYMDHDPTSDNALNPQLSAAGFPVYTPNQVGYMQQIPYNYYMQPQQAAQQYEPYQHTPPPSGIMHQHSDGSSSSGPYDYRQPSPPPAPQPVQDGKPPAHTHSPQIQPQAPPPPPPVPSPQPQASDFMGEEPPLLDKVDSIVNSSMMMELAGMFGSNSDVPTDAPQAQGAGVGGGAMGGGQGGGAAAPTSAAGGNWPTGLPQHQQAPQYQQYQQPAFQQPQQPGQYQQHQQAQQFAMPPQQYGQPQHMPNMMMQPPPHPQGMAQGQPHHPPQQPQQPHPQQQFQPMAGTYAKHE